MSSSSLFPFYEWFESIFLFWLYFQNCSFSFYFSPNSGFSFLYVNSIWHFFLKRHFHVFTQQETIYSRAHLVLTNLLITSLLVLCFSHWFLLFLPPKILLISCHPRLLFRYLLFRYRWAHHLCFLSMNDLSRSSFFDIFPGCIITKSFFQLCLYTIHICILHLYNQI